MICHRWAFTWDIINLHLLNDFLNLCSEWMLSSSHGEGERVMTLSLSVQAQVNPSISLRGIFMTEFLDDDGRRLQSFFRGIFSLPAATGQGVTLLPRVQSARSCLDHRCSKIPHPQFHISSAIILIVQTR